MRAVAFKETGPIAREDSLVDLDLPDPVPGARDLLVRVQAGSVNPIDTKVRGGTRGPASGDWRVLGYDAAGEVIAVGAEVTGFAVGDAVYYAGQIDRQGSNAEVQAIDARIVGRKPASLDWAEAAALPLTAITAWEALFDRIEVTRPVPGAAPAVLVVNGAGGVGSIAIQLLRALTELTVIATASRPETIAWVQDLGAHHVIDHRQPLAAQVKALGIGAPGHVFATSHTGDHLPEIVKLLQPLGKIGVIDEAPVLDVMPLKAKGLSLHWEIMFARSLFRTPDMAIHGEMLNELAALVDAGRVRTTLTRRAGTINAANLKAAHALVESGTLHGKLVLEGW